jgi:hypothetical protein
LPATIDQRAGPPLTPANRHTSVMTRPPSGEKEERNLRGDVSDFTDVNPLHDLFPYLQIQMLFEHDPHECITSLQALLRAGTRLEEG